MSSTPSSAQWSMWYGRSPYRGRCSTAPCSPAPDPRGARPGRWRWCRVPPRVMPAGARHVGDDRVRRGLVCGLTAPELLLIRPSRWRRCRRRRRGTGGRRPVRGAPHPAAAAWRPARAAAAWAAWASAAAWAAASASAWAFAAAAACSAWDCAAANVASFASRSDRLATRSPSRSASLVHRCLGGGDAERVGHCDRLGVGGGRRAGQQQLPGREREDQGPGPPRRQCANPGQCAGSAGGGGGRWRSGTASPSVDVHGAGSGAPQGAALRSSSARLPS